MTVVVVDGCFEKSNHRHFHLTTPNSARTQIALKYQKAEPKPKWGGIEHLIQSYWHAAILTINVDDNAGDDEEDDDNAGDVVRI